MEQINWGIVGPGFIAREFIHDLALVEGERHVATAVLGREEGKTSGFAQDLNIDSVFVDLDEMIRHADIDCAYIATPHPLHYEQCLRLLDAKIPVLCEKPLAINEKQVAHLVEAARENNTFLMEGMWIRCLPSIQRVLAILETGTLGEINSIVAAMSYKAPYDPANRYFNPALGGGSLLDLGVYPTYLSYLLLGMPTSIKATATLTETQVDGGAAALFSYPSGAYAVMESSFIKRGPLEAYIYGENGSIKIGEHWNEKPSGITVQFYDGSDHQEHKLDWPGRGFQYEVEEMWRCIREGKIESDVLPHKASLDVIRIIDEIRRQSEVRYPEFD